MTNEQVNEIRRTLSREPASLSEIRHVRNLNAYRGDKRVTVQ